MESSINFTYRILLWKWRIILWENTVMWMWQSQTHEMKMSKSKNMRLISMKNLIPLPFNCSPPLWIPISCFYIASHLSSTNMPFCFHKLLLCIPLNIPFCCLKFLITQKLSLHLNLRFLYPTCIFLFQQAQEDGTACLKKFLLLTNEVTFFVVAKYLFNYFFCFASLF